MRKRALGKKLLSRALTIGNLQESAKLRLEREGKGSKRVTFDHGEAESPVVLP